MNYLEEVTKIQTKTGRLFDDEKAAEAYIIDDICAEVNELLKAPDYWDLKYQDLVKIITALTGSIQNAERLKAILDKHLGG